MVIMASGIARRRVRTTEAMATESRNMTETCSLGLPCNSLIDIGNPCHDQLTHVKTRFPGYQGIRGLKSTTHRRHVFFEVDR